MPDGEDGYVALFEVVQIFELAGDPAVAEFEFAFEGAGRFVARGCRGGGEEFSEDVFHGTDTTIGRLKLMIANNPTVLQGAAWMNV